MVKEYVGYIDIFSQKECADIINKIDSLRNEWTMFRESSYKDGVVEQPPLWSLGASSSRDLKKGIKYYHKIKSKENEILLNNFNSMYTNVLESIEPYFGNVELESDLALPGFFIFGEKEKRNFTLKAKIPENWYNMIHRDELYSAHYDFLKTKYKKVENYKIISITLSILLPQNGSGLCVWDEELSKFDTNKDFAKEIIDCKVYENFELGMPTIVPYITGSAFCFSGNSYHQIAPICTIYPEDRRVTLQAHGMVCDGAWRLFF